MARTAAESYETARRHGWLEAIFRIVDEAPPTPESAVDILRASGFPVRPRTTVRSSRRVAS